jgi:glucose-6-phosphate 1-dehydrogenase
MIQETITLLIFGASGDLTHRKLVPALYGLYRKGRLPAVVHIVGFSRTPYSHEDFRERLRAAAQEFAGDVFETPLWDRFVDRIWYVPGDLRHLEDYERLQAFLSEIEGSPANRLYYLSTAPDLYEPAVECLGAMRMAHVRHGWCRIVVEKPFGHDLSSARSLNEHIHRVFDESQVYRIDHYLGKETAQNILFFRFANTIFEPVWNRRYVDHVQITVAESMDVGRRGSYYDGAGVLRDMVQNHLLQLLTLVAMEPPVAFDADAIRDEKNKVLRSIRPISASDTVRAQYEGYCDTPNVAPGSQTPTYTALKLYIDNWRWRGVPIYLRSGKAMARKVSEVVIEFQSPPHLMFNLPSGYQLTPNIFSLCIQPDEGIHLKFETKVPDSAQETRSVNMDFHYRSSFGDGPLPDAYERLLLDALKGDASLFTRSDGIEMSWRLVDPVIDGWELPEAPPLVSYPQGSWGPQEGEELLARDGHIWRHLCCEHVSELTVKGECD